MNRLRHDLLMIAVMILAIVAFSCATTPKQKQLMSIETFNGLYKQYLDEYDRQPLDIQAKWKADIDPLWATASDAIKSYAKIKDPTSLTAVEKSEAYTTALNQALKILLTYGVEIKEE